MVVSSIVLNNFLHERKKFLSRVWYVLSRYDRQWFWLLRLLTIYFYMWPCIVWWYCTTKVHFDHIIQHALKTTSRTSLDEVPLVRYTISGCGYIFFSRERVSTRARVISPNNTKYSTYDSMLVPESWDRAGTMVSFLVYLDIAVAVLRKVISIGRTKCISIIPESPWVSENEVVRYL